MESGRFPTDLLERRIHLVTGKGGVGRTATAAAMARLAAAGGKRVLLCEIGDPDGGPSSVGILRMWLRSRGLQLVARPFFT